MYLVLAVLGESAEPLRGNARQSFGPDGGSVGRGGGCSWRLPDPTNTLSGRHALIAFNGSGFTITDTSTNGVYINTVDAPLGRGNTAPLVDGDTLYMANYIISVTIESDPVEEHQRLGVADARAVNLGPTTQTLYPFTQASAVGAFPAAGPLGRDVSPSLDPPKVIGGRQASCSAVPGEAQAHHPPSLLADEAAVNVVDATAADLAPQPSSAGITAIPSSRAQSKKCHSMPPAEHLFVEPPRPPPPAASDGRSERGDGPSAPIIPEDLDLSDLLPAPISRRMPSAAPQRADMRFGQSNEVLQIARKPVAPPPDIELGRLEKPGTAPPTTQRKLDQPASVKRAAGHAVSADGISNATIRGAPPMPAGPPSDVDELQVFWNALGLNPDLVPSAQRREFFAELGRAIAEMTHGLHSVLAAWAMLKNECQIGPPLTRAGNDNALQFTKGSHALREALAKDRGFLMLSRSVRASFDDIRAHEAAAIAAMRGTVSNVLTRMSPQRIENDAASSGHFGTRVNKAKLWDRFVDLHASMVGDIDRTARTYIAEEFTRSYETQRSAPEQSAGKTA